MELPSACILISLLYSMEEEEAEEVTHGACEYARGGGDLVELP